MSLSSSCKTVELAEIEVSTVRRIAPIALLPEVSTPSWAEFEEDEGPFPKVEAT